MSITRRTPQKYFLCAASLLLLAANSRAQDAAPNPIHWAYSSYFGTGWYQVNGDRDVFVLRVAPRWELRKPGLDDDSVRTIGIELSFPVTAGLDRFDLGDLPGAIDLDNLASLSLMPEINITVPINKRWALRPFAAAGWGSVLNGSESAWTYWGGIKSRYAFQNGNLDWALVNTLAYVGYTPNEGPSEYFLPLMAGLEFDYPLGNKKWDDEVLLLSWHGMYTSFESNLDFVLDSRRATPITDQWEFGMSFHKQNSRIRIWWFSFDRLGIAYRFSTSGDLKGIGFVFRSIFER